MPTITPADPQRLTVCNFFLLPSPIIPAADDRRDMGEVVLGFEVAGLELAGIA